MASIENSLLNTEPINNSDIQERQSTKNRRSSKQRQSIRASLNDDEKQNDTTQEIDEDEMTLEYAEDEATSRESTFVMHMDEFAGG